jgi:uncharacterized DUF497 family protein
MNDDFQWDEAKAASNLTKHNISFKAASRVFEDIDLFVDFDTGPHDEQRFRAIGIVNALLITVTYTERGDSIRIISARKATKHEQKTYYQSQKA